MIITDITQIGDPQILLYEGTYYCYATSCEKGFNVWTSHDLVHWSEGQQCFNTEENCWGACKFWAPEVVYHNGSFIMHYTAETADTKTLHLGVAVSDSPLGPFTDKWGKPFFDLGYATIDGSVLISPEGNWFYYSRDCSQNNIDGIRVSQLYCVQLDETLTRTVGEHTLITTPEYDWEKKSLGMNILWNEGPTVIRQGDRYVMNYSANCYASTHYSICIATAPHPAGPWTKDPGANPVLSCRKELELFGAGHNAFFTSKDGRLMTAFHVQTNPEKPGQNRRICIGEVHFSEKNSVLMQEII